MATEALQIDALLSGLNDPDTTKSYSGAIVATFAADGATPKAVWTNKEKTAPTALGLYQITLDSNGQYEAFGDGVYVFKVYAPTDTGLLNPLQTWDGLNYNVGLSPDIYEYDHNTDGSHIVYESIADLRASVLTPFNGQVVQLLGHSSVDDFGGGLFSWDSSSTATDDDGVTIKVTTITTGRWIRRIKDKVFVTWWGAVGTGGINDTSAIQAAADYAVATFNTLYFPAVKDAGLTLYRILSQIDLDGPVSIEAESKQVTLLCVGCDGFVFANAASMIRMSVRNIGIKQQARHTSTPNNYNAIQLNGDTSNRPYWNTIENVFIDGFGTALDLNWCWETKIDKISVVFGGVFIDANGVSVNNNVTNCGVAGNDTAFMIGDGTNTCEGWFIDNNLIDGLSLGVALNAQGCSYGRFTNNICDFMGPGTGVLIQSAGSNPAIGWEITNNYIAFSSAGVTGIRLLNSVTPNFNPGTSIDRNTIFPYSTYSLGRGILIDGTDQVNDIVSKNNCTADTYDMDVINSTTINLKVINNNWIGGGFFTDGTGVKIEYNGNNGILLINGQALVQAQGATTNYHNVSMPSTGAFVTGDISYKINPGAIDGNGMVLIGWFRLTTGSAHVAGTDWSNMYISNVSPAT